MPEWLRDAVQEGPVVPFGVLVARLTAAFLLGCLAAGVYQVTMRSSLRSPPTPFLATLVLLSVLIALVTLVIGNSVARAFSLVGALAIVRFRTVVEDTRDTAFVIYAVVVGMAAGAGYLVAPLVATPLVLLAAWLFRIRGHRPATAETVVVLRLGGLRPMDARITELLAMYLEDHRLVALATARGGAALDVTYSGRLATAEAAFALVGELSRLEGVQAVELKER